MPLRYPVLILLIGVGVTPSWAQTTIATPSSASLQAGPAQSPASSAVVSTPKGRLQDIQARITKDAAQGILKTESVTALEGKQSELENRAARLEGKPVTADEKTALNQSIQEQEARLKHYEQLATPVHKVDPASIPPATYVTPNGTAIIAPGASYGNSGVVIPQNGPAMNPPSSNMKQAPAANTTQ